MPKRESCASILLAPRPPSRSPPTYDPHSHSLHCRVPYSRDFVHWRFSDAGRRSAWIASSCRRPKTCTIDDIEPAPIYTRAMRTSGRRMPMKLPRQRLLHLSRMTITIGFGIALAASTASDAAEIKVLTSRAMNHVLTELAGAFQRTSEHKVALILAPPAEIKRRIVNGRSEA